MSKCQNVIFVTILFINFFLESVVIWSKILEQGKLFFLWALPHTNLSKVPPSSTPSILGLDRVSHESKYIHTEHAHVATLSFQGNVTNPILVFSHALVCPYPMLRFM